MDYEYDFYYEDGFGDKYSSDVFDNLPDCREEIRRLESTGHTITRTFKYIKCIMDNRSGEYKGSFNF